MQQPSLDLHKTKMERDDSLFSVQSVVHNLSERKETQQQRQHPSMPSSISLLLSYSHQQQQTHAEQQQTAIQHQEDDMQSSPNVVRKDLRGSRVGDGSSRRRERRREECNSATAASSTARIVRILKKARPRHGLHAAHQETAIECGGAFMQVMLSMLQANR